MSTLLLRRRVVPWKQTCAVRWRTDLASLDLLKATADEETRRLPAINAFTASTFSVAGTKYKGGIVLQDGVIFGWDARTMKDINQGNALAPLLRLLPKPEVLVIGTGAHLAPLSLEWRTKLKEAGITFDLADTRNGIATYNVLAEEGRRVAAALLPINAFISAREEHKLEPVQDHLATRL